MAERLESFVCAMCIDETTGLPMPKLFVGSSDCACVDGYNTAMVLDEETGRPMQKVKIVGVDLATLEKTVNDTSDHVDELWKDVKSTSSKVNSMSQILPELVERIVALENKLQS